MEDKMKTHFGIFKDCGDYEHPLVCCEETLCGLITEIPCENSSDDWKEVDCKKCLKLRKANSDKNKKQFKKANGFV